MTVRERDPGTWPLGPVLENQRKKLGLTLDQVAARADLGRGTVRYYELGYRADNGAPVNPTTKVLRPLAVALELDIGTVLDLAGIQPARRKTDEVAAAEVARRSSHLADRIALLPAALRSAIETIVDEHLKALGYVNADDAAAEVYSGPSEELRTADPAAGPDELPLGNRTSDQAPLPK